MKQLPEQWQPSPAAEQAVLAAQKVAQERLKVVAHHMHKTLVPADGVLYQVRIAADPCSPQVALHLRIVWPGVLELMRAGVGVVARASLNDASLQMPERLVQLRARCPAERVLLKTTLRRPHTTPVKVSFDAGGVLRVCHARTGKQLAVSEPGNPFRLSPCFKALSFHDLMPRLR